LSFFREYVWKINKVPEIMDTSARDQVTAFSRQVETLDEIVHEPLIHFPVVYEPGRTTLATILQPFLDLLHQRRADIVVDVDLSVARHFENPGFIRIVSEIGEYVPEIVPDDVLQQDDVVFIHRRRRQQDEPAQH